MYMKVLHAKTSFLVMMELDAILLNLAIQYWVDLKKKSAVCNNEITKGQFVSHAKCFFNDYCSIQFMLRVF